MLVLSRKKAESIFINGNIVVTVLSIRGNGVRLGIEAPTEMPIRRRELYERIKNPDVVGAEEPVPDTTADADCIPWHNARARITQLP